MRLALKNFAKSILYHTGVFDALRLFQKNRVIILMYHRFSDKPEPFKIPKDVFEKQIAFLKKKYNFISLTHYIDVLSGKKDDLPPNPIILTIDDGYWDNYAYAYPILKKHRIPATIFLTTDFVMHRAWLWANKLEYILRNTIYKQFTFSLDGQPVNFDVSDFGNWHRTQLKIFYHCATIPNSDKDVLLSNLAKELKVNVPEKAVGDFLPLTWDQVREMHKNGISFGSHTCSHPILSKLTREEVTKEARISKSVLEGELNNEVNLFCYPNGRIEDLNKAVVRILKECGYRGAVTTIPGHNSGAKEDPYLLKRISLSSLNKLEILLRITRP